MAEIVLPNGWTPEPYQLPSWRYLYNGGLRLVEVWHRRAGKDSVAVNWGAFSSQSRIGNYWHMLPEYAQARKAIWDAIDREGRRVIDQAFPLEMRTRTVDDEMKIVMRNGSTWQVGGSDRYNALVGSNPVGVTFSEYSISNPAAWDFVRPILLENGGWAIFPYTPRGRNHGKDLFDMAQANMLKCKLAGQKVPDWFAELLTVNDTFKADGTRVITPEMIAMERESGMDDDMIEQEYFCSWLGVRQGAIFASYIKQIRERRQVGKVPYDRRYAVNTFWDIGHGDATSIWFHQDTGAGRNHFIHAWEDSGQDMPHYIAKLRSLGYLYGKHYVPHDAKNVTVAAKSNPLGKNIVDQMVMLGIKKEDIIVVPRIADKWTGITTTRSRIDTCYFDEEGCKEGLNALESYHKKWNETRGTFENQPYHDWSSNFADAFIQFGQGYEPRGAGAFTFPTTPTAVSVKGRPYVKTVGNRRAGY